MSYIDEKGYHLTSAADRLANLKASVKGIFGAEADVGPDTPGGQLLAMFAREIAGADALLADIYNQRSPSGAVGAQLARLSLINGVKKLLPALSTGLVTLTGTPGTVVPSGSLIGNSVDPTAVYQTVGDATIGGGGSVTGVNVQSQVAGAVPGDAGTLTIPMTVIGGWTGVTNPAGVSLGNLGETDVALRARRLASVALPSQGMMDGLVAALLQLPNVTQVKVRENPEDTTQTLADGAALAPHAIEVMVVGGDTDDIAKTIWLKKSQGVTLVGGLTVPITDSQGNLHDINFDVRGNGIFDESIYVAIHATPPFGPDVKVGIQNAIVAWAAGMLQRDGTIVPTGGTPTGPVFPAIKLGGGVPWAQIFAPINTVVGATGITQVDLGLTSSPTLQADIPGFYNQLPLFSAVNITFP